MIRFSFLKHAIERLNACGITKETISSIMKNPDSVIKESDCTSIYQKIIRDESKYLYRVFVNICKSPTLIITAYKTSKIDKYEH